MSTPAAGGAWALIKPWLTPTIGLSVAAVVVGLVVVGSYAFGGGAVSLENLSTQMGEVNDARKKFMRLDFTSKNDEETNTQELAMAEDVRSKFATFQKSVLATFPTLFEKDGKPLEQQKQQVEYAKLVEGKYKGKEEEIKKVAKIVGEYNYLVTDVANLPKDVDAISKIKKTVAQASERVRSLLADSQKLMVRLEADGALAKDKTLEQDINAFLSNARGARHKELREACDIVEDMFETKKGQSTGGNTVIPGGNTITPGGNTVTPGSNTPTKPNTATPTKNDKKKEGMAWYWWLVIIVGILSVLGAVAYLFLGTDPANDEEYSPEQEA